MGNTFVTTLPATEGRRLYDDLGQGAFAFRSVPYAVWSAQGEDVTATYYRSGKFVVQGKGTSEFLRRRMPGTAGDVPEERPAASDERIECPTAGSDESGKGDYFGPLAVAAVLAEPKDVALLESLGVKDSKLAGDTRIRSSEGLLAQSLPHAVRVLMPEEYNARYEEAKNVNVLLGRLHAEVLEDVCARAARPDQVRIVVDQFGDARHVTRHLGPASSRATFTMRTGGESNPAVAAASFLARAAFLRGFEEVKNLAGDHVVPRGASDPRIERTARALFREGGEAWLGKFAKLHFRVTEAARR